MRFQTISLICLVCLILVAPAHGVDVPFSDDIIISSDFDGVEYISSGDIDGDGDLDLAGAKADDSVFVWFENMNGVGTAWTEHTIATGMYGACAVTVVDLDCDGELDVLGSTDSTDRIIWFENVSGDGSTWSNHSVSETYDSARSVTAADLDRDGDLDIIAVAYLGDDVSVWLNADGSGTSWNKRTVDSSFDGATSVHAADFDSDGYMDLVGAAWNSDLVVVWDNVFGTGEHWSGLIVSDTIDAPSAVYSGDIDSDGDIDFACAGAYEGTISWFENTDHLGTSWTRHVVTSSFDGGLSIEVRDVDADGDLDILGASSSTSDITWWENTAGNGSAWSVHNIEPGYSDACCVHAVDIDSDGDCDVLGSARDLNGAAWWRNETIGRDALFSTENLIDGSFALAYGIDAADMDADGDLDILGAAWQDYEVNWWENTDGLGTVWVVHNLENGMFNACDVEAADMDADGDLDVVALAAGGPKILNWYENIDGQALTWTEHEIEDNYSYALDIDVLDMDCDGDPDVICAGRNNDRLTWMENRLDEGLSWYQHIIAYDVIEPTAIEAVDLDRDGDPDILCASEGHFMAWWENDNGAGTSWTEYTISETVLDTKDVLGVDIDGDGDFDIVTCSYINDVFTWLENIDGYGQSWVEHTIADNMDGAYTIAAGDYDLDGDLDIVGGVYRTGSVVVLENADGQGLNWNTLLINDSFSDPRNVITCDINSDGYLDVAATADDDYDITWWPNLGGQFGLPAIATAPESILPDELESILTIEATHYGRVGDTDLELTSIELLFEAETGTPLTTAQINSFVDVLHVYRDTGSGEFEAGPDTMVGTIMSLTLIDGVLTIDFADGDSNVQVPADGSALFFIVLQLNSESSIQSISQFQMTLLSETSGTAEDRESDIALRRSQVANTVTGPIHLCRTVDATVDTNGSGDFETIQEALDTCCDDTTIWLEDGLYEGGGNSSLDFRGKSIVLRSISDDPEQCIIDCLADGRGVSFHSGETSASMLRGVTIQSGYFSDGTRGAGIYCANGSSPSIINCHILNCETGGRGGGVYCIDNSSPDIINCIISGNQAGDDGGGILCQGSAPNIVGCLISNNTASDVGGGIYSRSVDTLPVITNCTIVGNESGRIGGGLSFWQNSPVVTNCTIADNTTSEYGGGVCCSSASPTLINCILWGNSAGISGDEIGMEGSGSNPEALFCTINTGVCPPDTACSNCQFNQDPLFVGGSPYDYHLQGYSPCLDQGTGDTTSYPSLPTDDIDGDSRPIDSTWDIGSDEQMMYTPVPTATPTVSPTPTLTPSPTVTPTPTNTPIPTTTPTPLCFNHGDVNFSGFLTAEDSQITFNIVLGIVTPTFDEACAADCDGNDSVTAADSQLIFFAVLGMGDGCVDNV